MDQLLEMAKDLAREIQQDERYIRTQMAQAEADADEELQGMIGEFNLKRMAINAETGKEEKDGEKLKKLDAEIREVYARIMANERMVQYNDAKTALDELVGGIARIITMSAQGADPDEIEEQHDCGGNCGSCGGCH